jgi:hypothetical protein
MPGSCVPDGAKVKVLTIQHNHWGRIFFSIQECIFGIRRIQGKMRSTVWTVCTTMTNGGNTCSKLKKVLAFQIGLVLQCLQHQ